MDKMRYKVRLAYVGGVLLSHEKENKALRWLGDQRVKPPFSWDYTIINNPWMFCSIPMKQIRILLGWRSNKTEFLKRSLPNGPGQTLRCVIPGIPENSAGWAAWSLRKLPQNRPHRFWWWDPTFLGGYVRLQFFWGGRMTRLDGAKHIVLNWVETTT